MDPQREQQESVSFTSSSIATQMLFRTLLILVVIIAVSAISYSLFKFIINTPVVVTDPETLESEKLPSYTDLYPSTEFSDTPIDTSVNPDGNIGIPTSEDFYAVGLSAVEIGAEFSGELFFVENTPDGNADESTLWSLLVPDGELIEKNTLISEPKAIQVLAEGDMAVLQAPANTTQTKLTRYRQNTETFVELLPGWKSDPDVFAYDHLSASDHGDVIAYAELVVNPDFFGANNVDLMRNSIKHWRIKIHTDDTSEAIVLETATRPVVSTSGERVYFLKQNGWFVYDVSRAKTHPIFTFSANTIPATVSFDITPDEQYAVMSFPVTNQVLVYELSFTENGVPNYTEVGYFAAAHTTYFDPVISPEGSHYAVVALIDNKTLIVEIRSLMSADILYSTTLVQTPANVSTFTLRDFK